MCIAIGVVQVIKEPQRLSFKVPLTSQKYLSEAFVAPAAGAAALWELDNAVVSQ